MTLILGLLTQDYVLLAADRRVTFLQSGDVKDDERCKLVSLCGHSGIAYTGLAELGGCPTHEWICHRLVDVRARAPLQAFHALRDAASAAFTRLASNPPYRHSFLLAGYTPLKVGGWAPYFALVSNGYDADRKWLPTPSNRFIAFSRVLQSDELYAARREGVDFRPGRGKTLDRNVSRLLQRGIGAREVQRLLVDEIVYTAVQKQRVGKTVLAVSIPRAAVEQNGQDIMVISGPTDPTVATFGYFRPGFDEVKQYGPAFACGDSATTDFVGETYGPMHQSVQVRLLRVPGGPSACQ